MFARCRRWMCAGWLMFTWMATLALAAPSSGSTIVVVADSRRFPAWQAWWVNLYNDSRWYFTFVVIATILVLGFTLGFLTDLIMSRVGINLKSRVLSER